MRGRWLLMTLKLYTISDDKRNVTKTLGTATELTGTLREQCSVINPVITVESSGNLSGKNYAFISEFSRYYYINNIEAVTDKLWRLTMHVDVLMSNATSLLALPMIAARQENLINHYLNDGEIPSNSYRNISTYLFSEGESFRDGTQTTPFALIVAGEARTS